MPFTDMQNMWINMTNNMSSPASICLICKGYIFDISVTSGILYTWYKAVQGGMYWYVPVRTLLDTWPYEKPQNGTYQYVPT